MVGIVTRVLGIYTVGWLIHCGFCYSIISSQRAIVGQYHFMPLLQYIRLIDIMARMGLRADASRFFLGYVWWILEPLLWVGVLYVVFVTIMGTREPDFPDVFGDG